jgi:hypothetical protein
MTIALIILALVIVFALGVGATFVWLIVHGEPEPPPRRCRECGALQPREP